MNKEKQIEALEREIHRGANTNGSGWQSRRIAEHLYEQGYRKLSDSVIELPCKVGDDVCWIDPENEVVEKQKFGIKAVCYYGNGKFKVITEADGFPEELHTDWCMLTEEEANKRLLERNKK